MHPDLAYTGNRLHLAGTRVIDPEHHVHEAPHRHHHFHWNRTEARHGYELDDGPTRAHPADEENQIHRSLTSVENSKDLPTFRKNEAATNSELFYDLWFVANLNVFGGVHEISDSDTLFSFIGYIILLWTTWGVTTLFDVRFTADSALERACKAVHLGVMVGFAEIGSSFNPDDQIKSVFQAMSFFLAASRFVLACQYAGVAWQVRRYVEGWRPIAVTATLHLIAAAVYFGIAFRYQDGKNSRVYVVWFVMGIVELKLHLIFSQLSDVLTFVGTHLGERMNLLTLIIVGEGAILLAKNVTLLVKDTYLKDHTLGTWSPSLIGIVTCAAALIYTIFQLYFDWMHEDGMSVRHQVWWTSIHMPFHVALVLFLEGANQFIIWTRLNESITAAVQKLLEPFDSGAVDGLSSEAVSKRLGEVVYGFLAEYPPDDMIEVYDSVSDRLGSIAEIPDGMWEDDSGLDPEWMARLTSNVQELAFTMVNAVYHAFGIDEGEEAKEASDISLESEDGTPYMASEVNSAIRQRFRLVFIYAFICAGVVLIYLICMHVLSKRRGWTPFNILRTAICSAIALTLVLIPTIAVDETTTNSFIGSSWMLPVITIGYVLCLIITHVPHPRRFGMGKYTPGGLVDDPAPRMKQKSHFQRLVSPLMRSSRKQKNRRLAEDRPPVADNLIETRMLVHHDGSHSRGDSLGASWQMNDISQVSGQSSPTAMAASLPTSRESLESRGDEVGAGLINDQSEHRGVDGQQQQHQQLDTGSSSPASREASIAHGDGATSEQAESAGHNGSEGEDRLSRVRYGGYPY